MGNNRIRENEIIYNIFGAGANDAARKDGPTRLIVRDAYPDKSTIQMWENLDSELMYTEFKAENSIDRLTSQANPRFLERVVKGSHFNVNLCIGVYKIKRKFFLTNSNIFKYFITALRLLENSYLGGSGTRGYVKVGFKFLEPIVLFKEDYQSGSENFVRASKDLDILISELYPDGFKHLRLSDFDDNFIEEKITSKFRK